MFVDGCEGGDEAVWWEWDDRDVPTRGDSAVHAIFQMTVPEDRQFYLARATYTFSERKVILCSGDRKSDDKSNDNSWSASLSARHDTEGNNDASFNFDMKTATDSGIDITFRGEAGMRQDKDGNVQGNVGGRFEIGGEF